MTAPPNTFVAVTAGIYDRRRYGSGPGRDKPRQQYRQSTDSTAAHAQTRQGSQRERHESGTCSNGEQEEMYIVECACGITYDDGNLMIECERCRAWAHTSCLQALMVSTGADGKFSFWFCTMDNCYVVLCDNFLVYVADVLHSLYWRLEQSYMLECWL